MNHLDSSSSGTRTDTLSPSKDLSTPSLEPAIVNNEQDSSIGVVAREVFSDSSLSGIQANQHAITFLFSLIEGRCKSRARSAINAGRHPRDQLAETHPAVCTLAQSMFTEFIIEAKKTGVIPKGIAIPSPNERRDYLRVFDARLSDMAIQQQQIDSPDHATYRTIEDSEQYSLSDDASSLFERPQSNPHSRALVTQSLILASNEISASPLHRLTFPNGIDEHQPESPYYQKFREICLLGRGGFGKVFRVRHNLDDQDYAVKKIKVSASQLRSIHDQVQLEHLLKELRALAKLQHRNVVRYYDSWCENRSVSWRGARPGQYLLENGRSRSRQVNII